MPPKPPPKRWPALVGAGCAVVLTAVVSAVLVHALRARRIVDPNAAIIAAVAKDPSFRAPLALAVPSYTTVRRGGPEDRAYRALQSLGYLTIEPVDSRHYRHQRSADDTLSLKLTDQGWAAVGAPQDADTWQLPLARRHIIAVRPALGTNPVASQGAYWIDWQWSLTALGSSLRPDLAAHLKVPEGKFATLVNMEREGDHWRVVLIDLQ